MIAGKQLLSSDLEEIFENAKDFLRLLKGKKIFITGGTGFFGKWILNSIHYANAKENLGIELTILTRNKEKFLTKYPWLSKFNYLEGQLKDFDYSNLSSDFIIHAAAEVLTCEVEDRSNFIKEAQAGVYRILEFAKLASVEKILFMSSGAVYGPAQKSNVNFKEESELHSNLTAYGESKILVEEAIVASEIDYNILRCFAFLAPELPLDGPYAAGNFFRDALKGNDIIVNGDGSPIRSYMYMTDFCEWVFKLLTSEIKNKILNVGSDRAISIAELADEVGHLFDVGVKIKEKNTNQDPSAYIPNVHKAKLLYNLEIRVDLEESLLRTKKWLET